jgi:N-acyl-D-amino-acid deacylase
MELRHGASALALAIGLGWGSAQAGSPVHDLLIRGGAIYDGGGAAPYVGDVVVDGDRITSVGPREAIQARKIIDARGKAVAPGFINMLSQAQESLLVDGRALSDLRQGVTLEIMGEGDSMAPLTDAMARRNAGREGDIKYPIGWRSLGQYLELLEQRGVSPNVASFVGAASVRDYVLGEDDVQPTAAQLEAMRGQVHKAMQEGALGVASALIYTPGAWAQTPELIALASESGRCGGVYITHMRSEGDRFLEGIDETIAIARGSGAPTEIFHLKAAGRQNWPKLDAAIAKIEAARASGLRLSANMYPYTAAATGLDAAMPTWVQEGGLEAWIARMKDPAIRARLVHEMQNPPPGYESALVSAGAEGARLLGFKTEALKPLTGKTLAEVARMRGKSPEDTAIDLVIEDGSRIEVAYFLMSEANVRKEVALPWMSFGSDEAGAAPEGVFLESAPHPRAYGTFAKVLGQYVRDEKVATLQDAVRRMTALPAANLSLRARGQLKAGDYADIVVFDPKTIQDHATYDAPHQFATGVEDVLVNGTMALENGAPTGGHSGRVVRGRAWTGWRDGGCRVSAGDWNP